MSESNKFEHWLEGLGLGQYFKLFCNNDIDFQALVYLSDEDLTELGVSLGHRRILLAAAASLGQNGTAQQREPEKPQRTPEGERRQLTVMFCDLVGSTELSRRLDPEDLRAVMQQYRDTVAVAVSRYQGHVAQFMGDGVLAYFGWPQAYEDQAERAVRAALDSVTAVEDIKIHGGKQLRVRIGIDTGEVVVGDLVSNLTADFETATGETPNRAARLQAIAQVNQVVIGSNTYHLVGNIFELKDIGSYRLKGFAGKVPAWLVLGEREAESRFQAARGGSLTNLVGREHELGLLRERWELAKGSEGQVVLLCGEAGIGKSRLVQDFRSKVSGGVHFNLHYQCSPHHTNSAFYPVIQQLRRAAGFAAKDSNDVKLDKLENLLRQMREDVEATAPLFAALLSLSAEDRYGSLDLTPPQLRHRTIEVLIEQVLSLSRQRPVLGVVEDAHWIDPSMADFVAEFMPRIADQNVLMLITYRPENAPLWSGHPNLTSVTLNRLGRNQAAKIAHAAGGQELMDSIIDRIVKRADGVPLYIEELTKSVLERYESLDDPVPDILIPATLQSSLVARLDRLEEAKEIAQIGATIGREFTYDLLASVSEKTEVEIVAALDRLVQSGMVYRRGIRPNASYTFKHSLVQDAAYATILLSRRRRLHALIVDVIETQSDTQSAERIDLLAHHAYQGEVWEKAFAYLQQAGANAMDRAAIREAAAQFEQALSAGSHLPESRESLQRAIDLRFDLRNALWSIGRFEQILTHLRDAKRLAIKLDDARRVGWISVFMSASLWQLGRKDEAIASANNALAINETAKDLPLSIGANFYLGCAYVTSGDCQRAEGLFETVVKSLEGDLSRERCGLPFVPAVVARSWLVWALAERGKFDQGMVYANEALEIAKDVGHPFNLAHIYYDLGYFYNIKREYEQAIEALENAFHFVNEWKLTYLSPFIGGFLGHAYALSGRVDDGVSLLDQAVSNYEAMGLGLFRSLVTIQLAESLLLDGRVDEAATVAGQGLTLARERGERGHQAYGLRLLGEIALHQDSPQIQVAHKHFNDALNLSDMLGMRPLAAHCQADLARISRNDEPKDAEKFILQS